MEFDLQTYWPLFLYLALVLGFCVGVMVLSHLGGIKPSRKTEVKLMVYESGMDPIGSSRQQFDVKYYLIAILFLLFDVELLFLYPWAVAYTGGSAGEGIPFPLNRNVLFFEVLVFLLTLFLAYIYAWRKGVFQWRS